MLGASASVKAFHRLRPDPPDHPHLSRAPGKGFRKTVNSLVSPMFSGHRRHEAVDIGDTRLTLATVEHIHPPDKVPGRQRWQVPSGTARRAGRRLRGSGGSAVVGSVHGSGSPYLPKLESPKIGLPKLESPKIGLPYPPSPACPPPPDTLLPCKAPKPSPPKVAMKASERLREVPPSPAERARNSLTHPK